MWLEAAIAFQELGAGEILINYVDHEVLDGFNHELIKNASSSLCSFNSGWRSAP